MVWIFSTREVATIICYTLFFLCFMFDAKVRSNLSKLLHSTFKLKFVVAGFIFLTYASIFTITFALLPFWKWVYIKDILIWLFFSGFYMCFNILTTKSCSRYFRKIILDQIKLTVLVEFIISSFPLSLFIEIVFVLIATTLSILNFKVESSDKINRPVKLLANGFNILIIFLSISNIVKSINSTNLIDLIVSFSIPFVYLLLFLPVTYLFAIYARYESLYMRMSFKEPKNKKTIRWHHWEVFKICKFSYNKIDLFNQSYMIKMYVSMSDDSFRSLLADFKQSLACTN